jgi:hypothetical protein
MYSYRDHNCSCRGVGKCSDFMRALHLEQKDAVSKHPELSEYLRPDPKSGWPLLNFMTVPRSMLCQCGVICRASSFNYAEGCVIEIFEELFEHPE